jgi:hypothetical protein
METVPVAVVWPMGRAFRVATEISGQLADNLLLAIIEAPRNEEN